MSDKPYNPLDKENLGESVAEALLRVPPQLLGEAKRLEGAGIYAIYYIGDFSIYESVAELNRNGSFSMPIYVGKAVPKGARKGGLGFDSAVGKSLRDRLGQHASSISDARNLQIEHFYFRALTVDDIWIPLGENVLIEKFQPLWNRVIDGFGNKTPGARRATQQRSSWDVLHPGRSFVEKLGLATNPVPLEHIEKRVLDFFSGKLADSDKLPGGQEDEAD